MMTTFQRFNHSILDRDYQTMQEMLKYDSSLLSQLDHNGATPIFTVAKHYDDESAVDILKHFFRRGANINHQDIDNRTVIYVLCARGMIHCLNSFCKEEHLCHKDRLGQGPLFQAVRNNQLELIREITIDAELIDATDRIAGHTLLFEAAANGHDEMCKLLVTKGANPLVKDRAGQTLLIYLNRVPSFKEKVQQQIRRSIDQPKSVPMQQQYDELLREQAYQLKLIKGSTVRKIRAPEKDMILQDLKKGMKANNPQDSCFSAQTEYRDDYEDNNQDWRHIAMKIVHSCLHHKAGKWFQNTTEAVSLLEGKEIDRPVDGLMDLQVIYYKLQHHVYRQSKDFHADMSKIWARWENASGKDNLIAKYSQELKKHAYDLMLSTGFFTKC